MPDVPLVGCLSLGQNVKETVNSCYVTTVGELSRYTSGQTGIVSERG